jgi:hypothetical protein
VTTSYAVVSIARCTCVRSSDAAVATAPGSTMRRNVRLSSQVESASSRSSDGSVVQFAWTPRRMAVASCSTQASNAR